MLFETVTDLESQADVIRRRRYGVIEMANGELQQIRLRPLPKLVSLPGVYFADWWFHRRSRGDRCWLYYNQPWRFPNYLALIYVVSQAGTSFDTVRTGFAVLDQIARIKRSDALLCDASNRRISDRLMRRGGWEPHAPQPFRRNYIKRFYGEYPDASQHAPCDTAMAPSPKA